MQIVTTTPACRNANIGATAVWPAWQGTSEKIMWDAKRMKVKNGRDVADQVAHVIRPTYRDGYSL